MHIAELWRYPVKSMAGEPLKRAEVRESGMVGDRVVHVKRLDGRLLTARTRPSLLLPLLVATDGAIAAQGHDGRRLRPNIVLGGVEGLVERAWPGRRLRIRDVIIGVHGVRQRCIIATFDPLAHQRERASEAAGQTE